MADLEAPSGADNSGGQDRIARRSRVRHSAVRVGAGMGRTPFSIDVSHLEWHDLGDCRYVDPELFFPDSTPDPRVLAICDGCPVKQTCLDFALEDRSIVGVWGGTSSADRDRIRGKGRAVQQAQYRAQKRAG